MEETQAPEISFTLEAEPVSNSKAMEEPLDDTSITSASSKGSDSGGEENVVKKEDEEVEEMGADVEEPEEGPHAQKEVEVQGNEETKEESGGAEKVAQLLAGAVASAITEETEVEGGAEVSGLNGLLQLLAAHSRSNDNENGEGPMLRAAKAGLDQLDLKYEVQPPEPSRTNRTISFGLTCKVGLSRVIIAVDEGEKKFHFYIKTPACVPDTKFTEAALFLTWVNYGLSIGNFEMDLNDGEVRFKSSNHLLGTELSSDMVSHTVALAVKMIDQFFPGLMAVVYGDKDPKEAHDVCMAGGRVESAQ